MCMVRGILIKNNYINVVRKFTLIAGTRTTYLRANVFSTPTSADSVIFAHDYTDHSSTNIIRLKRFYNHLSIRPETQGCQADPN